MDQDELIAQIVGATERLVIDATEMPLDEVGESSLLPTWSRAHVFTHLARNAEGLRNFLLGARSNQVVRMYTSQERRDADIEFGAKRPASIVLEDAIASSRNFIIDIRSMPADILAKDAVFARVSDDGPRIPVAQILQTRLSELEIHHVDLNWRYTFADSPAEVVEMFIDSSVKRLKNLQMGAVALVATDLGTQWVPDAASGVPVVSGPSYALLGWLTRRTDGAELAIEPKSPLPIVPSMG